MNYRVELTPHAKRDIKQLPRVVQSRILNRLEELAMEPRPRGVKKLRGFDNFYRLREGDYRIIYEVQDPVLLVLIVRVGHRKDVYQRLS